MDTRKTDAAPKALPKRERLLHLLRQGMVMVHLDARCPGVVVPGHLRNQHHLRLNLSYIFVPGDLTVDAWGVRCTLTFSGAPFAVALPWPALFAFASHTSKEFWLYEESVPLELLQVPEAPPPVPGTPQGESPPDEAPVALPRRGHLRLLN